MGLYEKNLANLKEHKQYLWEVLEQNELESSEISVYSKEARDGNLVLYIEKNGKEYRMNSAYRPLDEAKRWAEPYEIKHMDIVCMFFGLGNGYLIRELMMKAEEDTKFIIYEPNIEVIKHVMECYDLTDFIVCDNLLLVSTEQHFREALEMYINADNIEINQIFTYPQYKDMFTKEYLVFLKAIRDYNILFVTAANTERKLGRKETENMFYTLQDLKKQYLVSELEALAKTGVPAYIVAAGPSLQKNMLELKKAKNHGVIIAVDKANGTLLENDIMPDFTAVLDANKAMMFFLREEVRKLPLIASMSANAEILKNHIGDIYYCSNREYSSQVLKELGDVKSTISVGGSVSTVAFSACINAGFKKIVFVGQDLAYGEGGITHVDGGTWGEKTQGDTRYEVEDIYGGKVKTRNDWYLFLWWYTERIKEYPDVQFIDATEGGAKIPGTEICTLKEVVEQYQDTFVDCKLVMDEYKKHISDEQQELLHSILKKQKQDLKWLKKSMDDGEKAMNKLIRACENRSILKTSYAGTFKKVEEINRKAEKMVINDLLESFAAGEVQRAMAGINYLTDNELENKKKIYKQSKALYQVMQKGAEELLEIMPD